VPIRDSAAASHSPVRIAECIVAAREALRDSRYQDVLTLLQDVFPRLSREGSARDVAETLILAGIARLRRGEIEVASELIEAGTTIARLNALAPLEAEGVYAAGLLMYVESRYDLAEAHVLEARRMAERAQSERLVVLSDNLLGILASVRGDIPQSLLRYGSAYAEARRLKEDRLAFTTSVNIAIAHEKLGEDDAALARYLEAVNAADHLRHSEMGVKAAAGAARLLARTHDIVRARELAARAGQLALAVDTTEVRIETLRAGGVVEREAGNHGEAERLLEEGAALARKSGDALSESEIELDRVKLFAGTGRLDDALRSLNRVKTFVDRIGSKPDKIEVTRQMEALAVRLHEQLEAAMAIDPGFSRALMQRLERQPAAQPKAAPAPEPPTDLRSALSAAVTAQFVLGEELQGGMSRLFRARDELLARDVVIKVLPESANQTGIARFRQEMALMAQLQHPHILPLLHAGVAGTLMYYVMPFVSGESLRRRLQRQPALAVVDALSLLSQIAEALAFAHSRGVVHRDLKPENVLLLGQHAMLSDFGIARLAASDGAHGGQRLTATGISVGTPGYMAPEQVFGDGVSDARVDIYAFGVMAFELFAGRPPFVGGSINEIMMGHLTETAPDLRSLRPDVPSDVSSLVGRALSKQPNDRPSDAGELVGILAKAR
jgi:serine/threonine-protein kinase